jgi:hypothetical protein
LPLKIGDVCKNPVNGREYLVVDKTDGIPLVTCQELDSSLFLNWYEESLEKIGEAEISYE